MGGILDFSGISSIADLLKDGMDRIWPDPTQRIAAEIKIRELDNQLAAGQIAINQAEASSNDPFTSRARPFIMWVCGVAFAYKFVVQPFAIFAMLACGSKIDWHTLPTLDWAEMSPVLMMMLGGGVMRTVEKVKGVA
jgi:hypothetical protein